MRIDKFFSDSMPASVDASRYEKLIRSTRILAVLATALTAWFVPGINIVMIYSIIAVIVIFNTLQSLPPLQKLPLVKNKIVSLTMNCIFISLIVNLTGILDSPYYIFFLFPIISATYWYGYRGLIITILFPIIIFVVSILSGYQILIYAWCSLIGMIIVGQHIAKLGQEARDENSMLSDAKETIEDERRKLGYIINNLSEALLIVDTKGKVVQYNGTALEMLDTHSDLNTYPIDNIIKLTNKNDHHIYPWRRIIGSNKYFSIEDIKLLINKRLINISMIISPVYSDNVLVGQMILLRDVTKQKSLEKQKDEFVSVVSHELRTPIAITEGYLSTLLLPNFAKIDDKAREYAIKAYDSLGFLSRLVNDLTSLAHAERDVQALEIGQVDLISIIKKLQDNYQEKASDNKLKINYDSKSVNFASITTSHQRLEEILVNLITNAIKYGVNGGKIIISILASPKYDRGYRISIKDFGLGISAEDQSKLFNKFFRSTNKKALNINGTGIGLYICKQQAIRLGGSLSVESSLGHGSVFHLDLPANIPAHQDNFATSYPNE